MNINDKNNQKLTKEDYIDYSSYKILTRSNGTHSYHPVRSSNSINVNETENELFSEFTKDYEIKNGVLTWVNPKLKKFKVPDKVIGIGNEVFKNSKIKKVTLPEGLKYIGSEAFAHTKITSIKFPNSLELIETTAFYDTELGQIKIPKGCIISDNCFKSKDLLYITLWDNTKFHGIYCINACEGIFSVTYTIKYTSYENLIEFIPRLERGIRLGFRYTVSTLERLPIKCNFIIEGPPLSLEEKINIQKLLPQTFGEHCNNIKFYDFYEAQSQKEENNQELTDEASENDIEKTEEPELPTQNKIIKVEDQEINQKVDEIIKIIDRLPENNIIIEKINELLKEYLKDLKDLKPQYNENNSSLSLNISTKSITSIKPMLLAKLESIYIGLSTQIKLIDDLATLNECKEILDTDVNELPKENSSLEDKIKSIKNYTTILEPTQKTQVLDKITKYLNSAIAKIEKELERSITKNKELDLVTENNLDPILEIKTKITEIYEKLFQYISEITPYKTLLETLRTEKSDEYKNEDDIISTINNIRYIILKLSNSKYKEEITNQLEKITNKYIILIQNILDNEQKLKDTKYNKLEVELRKELIQVMEQLNNYAYLDTYEINKSNKVNLLGQLSNCRAILEKTRSIEINKDFEHQPITLYIIEIHNDIVTNPNIDISTSESIRKELLNIINTHIIEIETHKNIDSLEEYNEEIRRILKSIAAIDLKKSTYLEQLNEYNKHTK